VVSLSSVVGRGWEVKRRTEQERKRERKDGRNERGLRGDEWTVQGTTSGGEIGINETLAAIGL
jgi:hypothetical protein